MVRLMSPERHFVMFLTVGEFDCLCIWCSSDHELFNTVMRVVVKHCVVVKHRRLLVCELYTTFLCVSYTIV